MGRRHEFGFPSKVVSRTRFKFLAFFKCHELPRILFERIYQPSKTWNDEGEVIESCEENIVGIDSDIENIIQEAEDNGVIADFETLWGRVYIVEESWRHWLSLNTDDETYRDIQFKILELAMKAFPTPFTEISWMEIEDQLWDLVQTTCVPFLSVLNINDVMDYLDNRNLHRYSLSFHDLEIYL